MAPSDLPGRRRWSWTSLALWAGLVALLGGLGWVALGGCGLAWPDGTPLLSYCPAPVPADPRLARLDAERAREQGLEDRLGRLRLALVEAPACPPVQVAEAPPPPPPPPPEPPAVQPPEPPPPEPPPPVAEAPPPTAPRPGHRPTPPPPPPEPPVAQPQPQPPAAPPTPPPSQNPEFDQRVARAGGARGNVQVTLIWDNYNDLDLWVICPDGRRIYYASMQGCSGRLDVDANGGGPQTRSPVENVTWPRGAPSGRYRVEINHFSNHGDRDPTPYRVRIRIGDREQIYQGSLGHGQPNRVIEFTVP